MAQPSLAQINKQIEALQAQAATLRAEQQGKAIEKAKALIAEYELTPEMLFGRKRITLKRRTAKADAPAAIPSGKFKDPETGKVWAGRGKRPGWLRERIEAGEDVSQYLA